MKRRGIFIISVLLFTVLVAMFAAASIALSPSALQRATNAASHLQAQRALQTGVDYAIARIRQTPGGNWRGNPATPVNIQSGGLFLQEADGQVLGWVQEGGSWSRFRYRFNWEDGSGGLDNLNNAAQPWADLPKISLNTLAYNWETKVPKLDAAGAVVAGSNRFALGPHRLLLAVEGCSGSVLTSSNGFPSGFSSRPVQEKAEFILTLRNGNGQPVDSAASARGDLNFQVDANQSVKFGKVGNASARMRAKGSLSVSQPNGAGAQLDSPSGEVRTLNGNSVGSTQLGNGVSQAAENASDAFYNIPLTATPQTSTQAANLAGGVYEVDLVNGQPQVTFYPLAYDDYINQRRAGTLSGGTPATLDSSIQLTTTPRPSGNPLVEMRFTKDTKVTGSLGSLAIVPARGALQEGDQPLPGASGSGASGTYLADLANRIQIDLPTGSIVSGSFSGNAATSPLFGNVLSSVGGEGAGAINAPNVQLSYNNADIQSISNFDANWDGLPGIYNYQLGALQLAQYFWVQSQSNPNLTTALTSYVGRPMPVDFGSGTPPDVGFGQSLPNAGTGTGLGVKDLKITLQDGTSNGRGSVTLKANRDVTLGGMLEGQGGAVVTAGNLSLLGNGLDLSGQRSSNSINLYSAGDILVDAFAFDDSSSLYNNVSLEGVMYAWGNITVNVGKLGSSLARGQFSLKGAVVAYGGDPGQSSVTPHNISVTASSANLIFDPAYLQNLEDSPVRSDSHFQVEVYHHYPQ